MTLSGYGNKQTKINIRVVTAVVWKKTPKSLKKPQNCRLAPTSCHPAREAAVVVHGDAVCCPSSASSSSEHGASLAPLLHWGGAEHRSDGLVEHRLQASLGQGRALQVLHGP